jgi:hypothetical protein
MGRHNWHRRGVSQDDRELSIADQSLGTPLHIFQSYILESLVYHPHSFTDQPSRNEMFLWAKKLKITVKSVTIAPARYEARSG